MILADGVLGQAMEPVAPTYRSPPRGPRGWELTGAEGRSPRAIHSLHLRPEDLEAHNRHLQAKFAQIARHEVRWASEDLDDAEVVIVGYGTAARVARTVIERARAGGLPVGLFRPVTLWPFPAEDLAALAGRLRAVLVVEMSAGQLVEDVRLAVEGRCPVFHHGRMGGMVPTPGEVLDAVRRAWAVSEPRRRARPAPETVTTEPDPLSLIEDGAWADRRREAVPA
jgi:2-oxoglutarate/2-oxoacid ferredoxin oxidoreductase subunit alpha